MLALGGERWERWVNYDEEAGEQRDSGIVVGSVLHVADFFVWSALVTGLVWVRDTRRKRKGIAELAAPPNGGPAEGFASSGVSGGPPSVS